MESESEDWKKRVAANPERYQELTAYARKEFNELNRLSDAQCPHGHDVASACPHCWPNIQIAMSQLTMTFYRQRMEFGPFSNWSDRSGPEYRKWLLKYRNEYMANVVENSAYYPVPVGVDVTDNPVRRLIDIELARLDIEDEVGVHSTSQQQPVGQRLKWKTTTAAFVYIFNTLAERGYFELPARGGKDGGENIAEYARALLQAFAIEKRDGSAVGPEDLRGRLFPGSPGQLAHTKALKFQIPDARLIVPDAEDLGQ